MLWHIYGQARLSYLWPCVVIPHTSPCLGEIRRESRRDLEPRRSQRRFQRDLESASVVGTTPGMGVAHASGCDKLRLPGRSGRTLVMGRASVPVPPLLHHKFRSFALVLAGSLCTVDDDLAVVSGRTLSVA